MILGDDLDKTHRSSLARAIRSLNIALLNSGFRKGYEMTFDEVELTFVRLSVDEYLWVDTDVDIESSGLQNDIEKVLETA